MTSVQGRRLAAAFLWFLPEWIGKIGEAERDKVTQEFVTGSDGRQRVAMSRAGRTTIAEMLDYARNKCGLDKLLEELDESPDQPGDGAPSDSTPGGSDRFTAIAITDAV